MALLAPALVLPALVVSALAPKVGAVGMVTLSLVSTVALVMWFYRVGWIDAFSLLFPMALTVGAVGLTLWWSEPKTLGSARLNR